MQSLILDIRTLVLMVMAISVTLSIVMFYILQTRRTYPGFDLWTAGNAVFAAGFILIILRGVIPDVISVVAANALLLFSALLFSEGVRVFRGRVFRKVLCGTMVVLIVALQSYFTFVNNDIEVRIILISLFLGTAFGMGAAELLMDVQPDLRPTLYLTGSIFAFLSLFMILRALITYTGPGLHDFFAPSHLQAATYIVSGLFGIASTFGFITLNSERLESDLKSAQEEMGRLFEAAEKSRRELIIAMEERKLTGEILTKSEEKFRNIFEKATEGIYISTPQGRYVSVNPAFAKILGFNSPEEILEGVEDIGHQLYADSEDRQKLMNLLAGHDRVDGFEIKGYRRDGQIVWVSINAHAVRDENGALQFIEGTMNDITGRRQAEERMQAAHEERQLMLKEAEQSRRVLLSVVEDQKEAQEEIRKLNAELEQRVADRTAMLEAANRELEAFSYSVSHDLRSPLQHVTGFAELLNKRAAGSLDEKSRHYLKIITDSTMRMGRLIDDLLAFSRMGRAEMLKRKTNLDSLVSEILKDFKANSRSKNIDWIVGQLPEVYGDTAMLRQVFVNLISNAFKFTEKRMEAVIEIGSTRGEKDEVCVFVKDNGAGFDMKYVDKLFGIFQRLHRTEEFEGTGIGLANVRRIIQRHGGRVWAEGKEGEGATFFFTLSA
ncbi:MAG: PAS domain S-box protein [Proteobacteria bacterium]|nr:PAS domain S-box protein [Pseudomonadota bacterium]